MTRDHWVEVDAAAPTFAAGRPLLTWLVCNGWIHGPPTAPSTWRLGQSHLRPSAPASASRRPTRRGVWTVSRKQNLGFPEGKVKTILFSAWMDCLQARRAPQVCASAPTWRSTGTPFSGRRAGRRRSTAKIHASGRPANGGTAATGAFSVVRSQRTPSVAGATPILRPDVETTGPEVARPDRLLHPLRRHPRAAGRKSTIAMSS